MADLWTQKCVCVALTKDTRMYNRVCVQGVLEKDTRLCVGVCMRLSQSMTQGHCVWVHACTCMCGCVWVCA